MIKPHTTWTFAAAAAMLAGVSLAPAQTTTPKDDPKAKDAAPPPAQAPRKIKSVRKSVVDLEAMAKERRPGQVMPGDPTPVLPGPTAVQPATEELRPATSGGESTPAPAPAANSRPGTIQLPDTAPSTRNIVKPAPSPDGRTASIEPIPAPAPISTVAPSPAPAPPSVPPAPPAEELHSTPGAMAASSLPQSSKSKPIAAVAAAAASSAKEQSIPKAAHAEPLPQLDAGKPEAAPPAPVADVPVTLVDKAIIPNIPMALSTGPAKIHVASLPANPDMQWRAPGESWKTPAANETVESKIEVRGGLESDLVLIVDERVEVRVPRLGRATIERSAEAGGASAVSITITRGAIEVKPVKGATFASGEMFARVRTPDQMFGVTGALRIEYDAFTGTRRRTLNP